MSRFAPSALGLLLFSLVAVACSETTVPQEYRPDEKTYTLKLTSCVACDASTPPLALVFKEGVQAQIAVENVNSAGADGSFLALSQGESSLMEALPEKNFKFSKVGTGAYSGSVVYGAGRISVSLQDNGCTFRLTWPGVITGAGACLVQ